MYRLTPTGKVQLRVLMQSLLDGPKGPRVRWLAEKMNFDLEDFMSDPIDIVWKVHHPSMKRADLKYLWLEVSHERLGSVSGFPPPDTNDGVWRWRAYAKDPPPSEGGTVVGIGEEDEEQDATDRAEAFARKEERRNNRE